MNQPPVGTVTFLFTDIEGSTKLWQQHPKTMNAALARHHNLLNDALTAHGGYVFQIIGDAFCAAFATANDGIEAALDAQRALAAEAWGETGPIRVRMALHTGRAEVQPGEYTSGEYISGLTLSRAARLLSAGHGGQILLSLATAELVRDHLPDQVSLRDLGARRLKDLIRPEQIFQVVTPDLPADFAPLKTLDVHPHNLPVQLTSFIGREREMGEIKKQLAKAHLLTLTGIGGTGKTRLALQVAADLIDEFTGGIWLVELAPLRDPGLVEQTAATVLGVHEQPGLSLSDLLVEEVRDKHLLLILDNCEHVVGACAQLADLLLSRAPELKILATSRVHLNLAGEVTYPVSPLALPDPERATLPHSLAQYEAVRLFIERAASVQPSFSVTNENAPAVAQICTHLDGIPLAIELAAARTRMLSPEQISARLGDRFNLLTGGSRASLPRQQTLRAAMDWSYDLLGEAERTLFNRLAVFDGSFSLEAVETICTDQMTSSSSDRGIRASNVLDMIGALVDHSLVSVQERNSETRYVLLETVRQYVLEKLQACGELPALQDRHLDYYLKLAQEGDSRVVEGRSIWIDCFDIEYDNFRIAMGHALDKDPESAILLGVSLLFFQDLTGRSRESYGWALRILALIDRLPADQLKAKALWWIGLRQNDFGEFQQGKGHLEHGYEIAKTIGDKILMNKTIHDLGVMCGQMEDWAGKRDYAEQHLLISQQIGDKWEIACALEMIGESISHSGNRSAGRIYLEQSLELARQAEYPYLIYDNLFKLAWFACLEGDTARAKALFEESAQICRQMSHRLGVVSSLLNLGQVHLQVSEPINATPLFEESLAILREMKIPGSQSNCLAGFAGIAGISGQDERAAHFFGAAEAAFERYGLKMDELDYLTYDPIIAAVQQRLGEDRFQAEWAEGRKLTLEQALELALR